MGFFNKLAEDANSAADSVGSVLELFKGGPNTRYAGGISNRREQIMIWRLPNGSLVQMYINPENFTINESKQINATRTKGGFVVQYWGDNLTKLTLSGTTGSSGIRGINILRDVYRSENRAFDMVAASQSNELFNAFASSNTSDASVGDLVANVAKTLRDRNFLLRPSLASLAVGVTLLYQGVQYRGFFTEFTVTESVQKLGLFDYNLAFTVTERRGNRSNFMAWHKEPDANDLTGQLINAGLNTVGNSIRGAFGLSPQEDLNGFHPENAPLSFGGDSAEAILGLSNEGLEAPSPSSSSRDKPLTVTPASASARPGDEFVFTVSGGKSRVPSSSTTAGYSFKLAQNLSGATIKQLDNYRVKYTRGPNSGDNTDTDQDIIWAIDVAGNRQEVVIVLVD